MEALSDEELIARYRLAPDSDQSRQFIDELFGRHRTRVIAWCHRLSGDRELAPDLAQDVFIKAFSSLHTFRRDSRFTTWLYVIARNRCRDEARARSAARREAPEVFDPVAVELNDALSALDARDARTTVQGLMKEVLTETEQRVMTLHYGLEMELNTITSAL